MSKIIRLQSENIKRLRAVEITPKGNLVLIGGQNGQGKSSVLDSIAMGLGGGDMIPDVPVRQGEEKAKIVLELEDLVIRRTFTAAGGTALVVENKDGARYPKPQDMLDRLTGKLTFDPLEFIRLKPQQQLEALKKIVGLDFSALDAARKKIYDERTILNAQAKTAKAKAEFMPFHETAPAEEHNLSAIVAERDAAKEHNSQQASLTKARDNANDSLTGARSKCEWIKEEIASLERKLGDARRNLKEVEDTIPALGIRLKSAEDALAAFQPKDISAINTMLVDAEVQNKRVRDNAARADALREANKLAAAADALTSQIDEIDKQKQEALAGAAFPVPGLSFNDGSVLFNGIPFNQASSAEKLRVSLAMASATNPKLKIMLIRDGSLLDDQSLELLTDFATQNDLQVWLERVGDGDKAAVIIEDGSVKQEAVA